MCNTFSAHAGRAAMTDNAAAPGTGSPVDFRIPAAFENSVYSGSPAAFGNPANFGSHAAFGSSASFGSSLVC